MTGSGQRLIAMCASKVFEAYWGAKHGGNETGESETDAVVRKRMSPRLLCARVSDSIADGATLVVRDLDTSLREPVDDGVHLLLRREVRILHQLAPQVRVQHFVDVAEHDALTAALALCRRTRWLNPHRRCVLHRLHQQRPPPLVEPPQGLDRLVGPPRR